MGTLFPTLSLIIDPKKRTQTASKSRPETTWSTTLGNWWKERQTSPHQNSIGTACWAYKKQRHWPNIFLPFRAARLVQIYAHSYQNVTNLDCWPIWPTKEDCQRTYLPQNAVCGMGTPPSRYISQQTIVQMSHSQWVLWMQTDTRTHTPFSSSWWLTKYTNKNNVNHLIECLKADFKLTMGQQPILWDYLGFYMSGYIINQLQKYKHVMPTGQQHCPYPPTTRIWDWCSMTDSPWHISPLSKDKIKHIQSIIGSILYYARAVNLTVWWHSALLWVNKQKPLNILCKKWNNSSIT